MIVKKFKWIICVPIAIIVIALIFGVIFGGLNVGIDFTGGSIITADMGETFDSEVVRAKVLDVEGVSGAVSVVTSGDDGTEALIRLQNSGDASTNEKLVSAIIDALKADWPAAKLVTVDSVGGIASGELIMNAFLSVLIACVLMLIYIWIRFQLFSGIGAVIALAHDVLIMISAMCIFRVTVDSSFIAACLTIVGYSINSTVIIFDRMRENLALPEARTMSKEDIVDKSVRQTLGRTINTTVTTLIMIVCLYIFGVTSIKEFTFPIIIGLFAGTYSSLLIASSVWIKLDKKIGKKKHGSVKAIR